MIRTALITIVFSLVLAVTGWTGTISLIPAQVHNGELVMLRWDGPTPSFGVVRFNDRLIYLYPDQRGALALLPIGLDMTAGHYPLLVAVVDHQGETTVAERDLEVVYKERPLERLTLPEQMVSPRKPEVIARIEREHEILTRLFATRTERLWEDFCRPVSDPVNSVFGKRRLLNGKPKSPHSGTDFRSPAGTPVHAISAGRVVLAEDLFYTGQTVVIDHGEGLLSVYAHLSVTDVSTGSLVVGDQVIGRVGSTGRSTGPHLHLTVRLLGERIDPMALLRLFEAEES